VTELRSDRRDVRIEGRLRGSSEEGAPDIGKGLLRWLVEERSIVALVVCDNCPDDLRGRS
jgi:hypothetical protein